MSDAFTISADIETLIISGTKWICKDIADKQKEEAVKNIREAWEKEKDIEPATIDDALLLLLKLWRAIKADLKNAGVDEK